MTLTMYAEGSAAASPALSASVLESPTLYSLDLDVSSYERLRRQESLLVDFTEFLNNMVWLLQQACSTGPLHVSRNRQGNPGKPTADSSSTSTASLQNTRTFRASLCSMAGGATGGMTGTATPASIAHHTSHHAHTHLQIREHTAFRELAHLTLPIQSNTDKGMAKFLGLRLQELTDDNQRCRATIASLEQDGRALEKQLSALQDRVSADTNLHSNEASNWKMQCDMMHAQIVNAKEQHEFLREKLRAAEAGAASDKLQLAGAEATCTTMRDEIHHLKKELETTGRANVALQDAKLHGDREVSRLRDLCEGYKSASDTADARVEDWKRMSKDHEEHAAKVVREAQQLERKLAKTSQELEQVRTRLTETEQRATQRDALMQTQEEALQSAQRRVTDLQQQHRALEAQLEDARKQLEDTTKREAEVVKKSENSEKMIVWLNKQLTNIQLGGGTGVVGSMAGGAVSGGKGSFGGSAMKVKTPSPASHSQSRSRLARSGS